MLRQAIARAWIAAWLTLGLLVATPPETRAQLPEPPPTMGDQIIVAAVVEGTPLLAMVVITGQFGPSGSKPMHLVLIDIETGRLERQVELPGYAAAIAVDAVRQRVYLVAHVSRNTEHPLLRYDIRTDELRRLALPFEYSAATGPAVVDAVSGWLYVGGALGGMNAWGRYSLAFDADGRFAAELPGRVLAIDADLNRIYAAAPLPPGPPVPVADGLRIFAMDSRTNASVGGSDLITLNEPAAAILGVAVDRRRHEAVFLTCTAACTTKTLHIIDSARLVVQQARPTSEAARLLGLNEATGRAYVATHASPPATASLDLASGLVVARWQPTAGRLLAIEPQRNRLIFDRSAWPPLASFYAPVEAGRMALAVANGATETVSHLLPVFAYPRPSPTTLELVQPGRQAGIAPDDAFLQFWERHGGLAVFGRPITEPFAEVSGGSTQQTVTQYFERARLWLDSDPLTPADGVQIEALGVQFAAVHAPLPAPTIASAERRWFPETGHSVAYGFKTFWEANGGLATFGYPITEELREVNAATGQPMTVQYFERARFEYHPEHQGTPHAVQLGLLGRQVLAARGWGT